MKARSEAPKDRREYVRISVDMPINPKLMSLEEEIIPLAGWLAVTTICYCGSTKTDGHFSPSAVYRMAGVGPEIGKELIAIGVWHEAGHDCPKCPQPEERKFISHDYLEHQRSKAEIQALQAVRTAAGAKGAQARWSAKRAADAEAKAKANGIASAMANAWQGDGKAMAEVEVEEEEIKNQTLSAPPDGGTAGVTQIPVARKAAAPRSRARPKAAGDDPLFDAGPSDSSNHTPTQIIVSAYCDAVVQGGGVATTDMRKAIGRNVKSVIEKDHVDPAVVLVAAQRAGARRVKNLDQFLGDVQNTFNRAGQAQNAMKAEWYARAAALDEASALQQPQIGA